MKRHALTASTPLAIDPKAVQRDADGFFLMLGPEPPPTERVGSVAVVHIRGALAHFKEDGGDSYEGILERVKAALEEQDTAALVFRIESPGGVVSGLNETTQTLKALSKSSGVPFFAYVDELASSAAYHLCCACEEILAPPSAVVGSVGVISTMVSLAKADRMQGVEYRLITSGARKADGHLHAPITDAAEEAERDRNTKMAAQFFDVVRKARGMSVATIRDLEAGIYLAKDARRIGLIDDVASFDEVLLGLSARDSRGPAPTLGRGNVTDRRAKEVAHAPTKVPARATTNARLQGVRERQEQGQLEQNGSSKGVPESLRDRDSGLREPGTVAREPLRDLRSDTERSAGGEGPAVPGSQPSDRPGPGAPMRQLQQGSGAPAGRSGAPGEGGGLPAVKGPLKRQVARLSQPVSHCANTHEVDMAVKLDALIAKAEAAVVKEQDPKKLSRLAAQLAQYQATKVAMESSGDESDDEGEDDEGDDESKSAAAKKMAEKKAKMAEAAKHKANAAKHRAKAAEYEEAAKKCMGDDEEEAEEAAAVAPIERAASTAAIDDHVAKAQDSRIRELEKKLAEQDKAQAIAKALSDGAITPAQAKMLAGKAPTWVGEYLETTKGMKVVATEEGHLLQPSDKAAQPAKADPKEIEAVNANIAAMGITDPKLVEKLREDMLANRRAMANGQAGRY